ncbi:MAG: C45 family autoproteolytic acyltransferase/hydrolase [Patescibacteria group bacterium]|nr:C45 family autoproteolytic acyltransferase/hydrolase [Patescibacteria group bacterium]
MNQPKNKKTNKNPIPYLQIKAKDNFEFGLKLGEKLGKQIRKRIRDNKVLYKKKKMKNFAGLIKTAHKFLPSIKKHYPELLRELAGMSAGAKVDFNELLVLMCEEEILDFRVPHCTNIALQTEKGALLGHNEDWVEDYKNNGLYIVKGQINDRKFLALSYMGSLAGTSSGLNEHFCYTANSMGCSRFRFGVPVKFQLRALLDVRTEAEATRVDLKDSSITSNMVYVWKDSKILDIEDYFGHHEKIYADKFLVHTNHPVSERNRTRTNTDEESVTRYEGAKKILENEKKHSSKTLKRILGDHEFGICAHSDRRHPYYGITIASIIMNPREKSAEICWANSCSNKYKKYKL